MTTTTTPIEPPRSPTPPPASERPGAAAMFEEIIPLVDVVAFAGPPVAFLAGPWLLLVLLLIGPFALLFTAVIVCLLAVLLIAALVAIAVTPYLLVRRLKLHLPPTERTPSWDPRSFSSTVRSPSRRAGTA